MLSDRQLAALGELCLRRMAEADAQYFERMGGHVKEIGARPPSDIRRAAELRRAEANMRAVQRAAGDAAGQAAREAEALFWRAAEAEYRFFEKQHPKGRQPPMRQNREVMRIFGAQARQTAAELHALGRAPVDAGMYLKAVDAAVRAAGSGEAEYQRAIRDSLRRAGEEGLKVICPGGTARRLNSAVRESVLGGARRLQAQLMEQAGKAFGADGVEISAHALCAQDHIHCQGRQYSRGEFDRMQAALKRPIGQWNCRHAVFPILLGVSQPLHSEAELEGFRQNSQERIQIGGMTKTRYEWSREQRRLEEAIRRQREVFRLAHASADGVLRRQAQAQIRRLDAAYGKIGRAAGFFAGRGRGAGGFQAQEMNRRTGNPGAFSVLPERMSKKHIREIAKEYGIDIKGLSFEIDDDQEKLKPGFRMTGRADAQNIGRIDFFPKAFMSREELTRTLFHEKMHVGQFQKYGGEYVQNHRHDFEKEAYEAENAFIERLKREGAL